MNYTCLRNAHVPECGVPACVDAFLGWADAFAMYPAYVRPTVPRHIRVFTLTAVLSLAFKAGAMCNGS